MEIMKTRKKTVQNSCNGLSQNDIIHDAIVNPLHVFFIRKIFIRKWASVTQKTLRKC